MAMSRRRWLSRLVRLAGAAVMVLTLLVAASPPVGAGAGEGAASPEESGMLQYTAAGHVLAFDPMSVMVASASHMVRTEFVGAYPVVPQADDGGASRAADGGPAPLGRVRYPGLWDGVDLVYEADTDAIVKSTYFLGDGAAADSIRLRYNRPVRLDGQGNLLVVFEAGTMVDSVPVAWQETADGRRPVTVAYVLHGDREVGFSLGDHLPGIPVVIDPWLSFLGGSGADYGRAVAVDADGNVYVAGYSYATWGSPIGAYTSGSDAFVAKLDGSGNLVWNTFLGGSGHDYGFGVAVDAAGNVYVAGYSYATWGSPIRAYTSGSDAFAAELDGSGNLVWNTFLGGSGEDSGSGVAVNAAGNVYVAGLSEATWGSPVRAYTSAVDAFAAELDGSGNLVWNSFLGGSGYDFGSGVAVDAAGNVYVAGLSGTSWGSPVRPLTSGLDAFAAKLDSGGALIWNTFLGGSGEDFGSGVAVDASGNVYVVGYGDATWGSPVRAFTSDRDAFAAELDGSGNLVWNTFLGGSGFDQGEGVAVDASGIVYVAGLSEATWGSPVRAHTSGYDACAAELDGSGNLVWNTFLGGSGFDQGEGVAVDAAGNVYVAGESDATWGSPVRAHTSDGDAFVVQLHSSGELTTYPVAYDGNGATSGLVPDAQTKTHGVALTLASNSGGLARTGYVFLGWNTAADGSGDDYAEGGSYTADAAVILYARWAPIEMRTFLSGARRDGWVLESGAGTGIGGSVNATAVTARVGDDGSDRRYRAILSFNTSGLPDGAVVTGVTLRIRRSGVVGTNPFIIPDPSQKRGLNRLHVDIQAGFYHGDRDLETFDFQAAGSRDNVGWFIKSPSDRWYRAPLRSPSYPLVNRMGHTQFRLHFAVDDDGGSMSADYLSFYTGIAKPADRPQLIVTYYLP